jgi:hypothetical protein
MSVPIESAPMVNIPIDGTTVKVIEVDWPHRSVISKILAVVTDGAADAFTLAVFNHSQVQTGIPSSDSVGDEVGKIPNDMFRVTPDLVAESNGKLLYFSEQSTGGYGYVVFSNELRADRQGQKKNKVYVTITAATPGARKIALLLGGMKEVE